MDPNTINTVGLSLDIAGVVLLFFFGVPSRAGLDGVLTWGHGMGKDYKRARALSRLGFLLLIFGFLLQIASNHVGVCALIILPAIPRPQLSNWGLPATEPPQMDDDRTMAARPAVARIFALRRTFLVRSLVHAFPSYCAMNTRFDAANYRTISVWPSSR